MNIHEYQAKKLLSKFGILIPNGKIAYTPHEAKRAANEVSARGPWMLKAQIQSGAREKGYFLEKSSGKKGGMLIPEAEQMLGATLVTPQTGPLGKPVSRIYVEAFQKVQQKFYAALIINRVQAELTLLVAKLDDGRTITQVAAETPELILKLPLNLQKGVSIAQMREVRDFLGISEKSDKHLKSFVNGLHKAFIEYDASMIEINPFGVDYRGRIFALDAKMSFDDNAAYRHPDIVRLQDEYEEEDRALKARKYGFKYNDFDDSGVGCIVNGDGITLAAMDLIHEAKMGLACALNVKGGVDKDKIAAGIKIIMTNPKVEGILINILGGFLRCNLIADGIVEAASEVGLNVPLVVRFEGTNKDEAKDILLNSKLPLIIADDMEDSVDKLVSAVEAAY